MDAKLKKFLEHDSTLYVTYMKLTYAHIYFEAYCE